MKYFRFVCDIKTKSSEVVNTTHDSIINEVRMFCAYLSRMYEYYFPAIQTDHVVSITVCLIEDTQEMEYPQSCANMKVVANVIDIDKFNRLTSNGKSLYIIGLCQQSIMSLVSEMSWSSEAFEHTYNKIISKDCLFREYWRKAKSSPNRKLKAQIYFEDDYEKDGIYVDFTDKSKTLIKRVQFAPKGYHIYSKSISELQWENNSYVIIKRAFANSFTKTCDYWIIGVDGSIDYHSPRTENEEVNPHGLFDLGILYWEGKIVMQNQDKGLELIKKAAELSYKHAQKWIEQNISKPLTNSKPTKSGTLPNIINHIMITLYKQIETKGLYYKEMWYDNTDKIIIEHSGKVGYVGTVVKTNMTQEDAHTKLLNFKSVCAKEGYEELPEDQLCTIVVQFLLKSKEGNKRDKWLRDKVSEYLSDHLCWRGIGNVDSSGIDNGKLNIYCIVVDEERAVSAIKTCLKTYRLDLTHAIIAARNWDDEDFRVKYSHKPINDFSVI